MNKARAASESRTPSAVNDEPGDWASLRKIFGIANPRQQQDFTVAPQR
jgi:hypothetical protein